MHNWPLVIPALFVLSQQVHADSFSDALIQSKFDWTLRTRFEDVNASTDKNADALTLRTSLLFKSGEYKHNFVVMEFENTSAIGNRDFSNGVDDRGTAVIADPNHNEINQAYLQINALPKSTIQLGRQVITLDNQRFIGSVDFRQNQQSFDALSIKSKPAPWLGFFYAYLSGVNTVLGTDQPNGQQDLSAQLINLNFSYRSDTSLSIYHYDIENKDVAINSSKSTGVLFNQSSKLGPISIKFALEYAKQTDAYNNPWHYTPTLKHYQLGFGFQRYQVNIGSTVLGESNGFGFRTPLATLHKFQGFTDVFLRAPGSGLVDDELSFLIKLGSNRKVMFASHQFKQDAGNGTLGAEYSMTAQYQINYRFSGLFKFADYRDRGFGNGDIRKYWLQFEARL